MVDVVVIGGGPSGSASAIRLARAGLKVRLYEKVRLPRPKLCGGYLSRESIPEFRDLGLLDAIQAYAVPTPRILVSAPSGRQAETYLSKPAFSISRFHLDKFLLDAARAAGVEVLEGQDGLGHASDGHWTVIATGRTNPTRRGWLRRQSFYGLQAYFEGVAGITDQVELDAIPGGYLGLVRQDEGVNVCGLVNHATMRVGGPDLDQAMKRYAKENPLLQERMKNARRVGEWKAVGPVIMGFRQLGQGRTLYVGDAACVVDPFAGEGMAMGITAGRLLAEAFQQSPDNPVKIYTRLWHRQFDSSLRLQNLICAGIQYPLWQETLALGCQVFPSLMRWLTEGTRPVMEYA